jgi:hypothetical protein
MGGLLKGGSPQLDNSRDRLVQGVTSPDLEENHGFHGYSEAKTNGNALHAAIAGGIRANSTCFDPLTFERGLYASLLY